MALVLYEEFDTTVKGGLPVTVEFEAHRDTRDRDCGGGDWEIVDWTIIAIAGSFKDCQWLHKQLSQEDIASIEEDCHGTINRSW